MNGLVLGKAPPKISRSHQSKTLSKAPRAAACSWSSFTSPPKWLGDCFIPEGQLEETWTRPAAAFDSRFVAENISPLPISVQSPAQPLLWPSRSKPAPCVPAGTATAACRAGCLLRFSCHFHFPQETLPLPLRTWLILQVKAPSGSRGQAGPGAIAGGDQKQDGGLWYPLGHVRSDNLVGRLRGKDARGGLGTAENLEEIR